MKKLIPLFCALLLLPGNCKQIDTTEIWDNINSLEERVAELEKICKELNSNISALQLIVTALENNDYIKAVTPVEKDGEVIGYVLEFVYSGSVTIYHGEDGRDGADGRPGSDGEDGKDGVDGKAPIIGVAKGADGIYYWTVNGSWLLDENGQKVKAVGVDGQDGENGKDGAAGKTPELKIEEDKWFVSYDGGASWLELGQATGPQGTAGTQGSTGPAGKDGDAFFSSVDSSNPEYVLITLANGTELKIPTWKAFESLKVFCDQMNENIKSLQTIVAALQNKDYLSSITPTYDGATEIGYILTFTKSGSVTIYHGKDGAAGQDGRSPIVGVAKDTDDIYYWTVNGSWLLDENGQKVKAVGVDGQDGEDGKDGADGENGKDGAAGKTPELKIEEGKWFVSYDGGASWLELGQATGPQGPAGSQGTAGVDGDSFFQSVTETKDYVLMVLANGTEIKIPKYTAVGATLTLGEVTGFTATFNGEIQNKSLDLKVTVYYSTVPTLNVYKYKGKASVTEFNGDTFELKLTGLAANTTYYYFTEVINNGAVAYGEIGSFATGDVDTYVDWEEGQNIGGEI